MNRWTVLVLMLLVGVAARVHTQAPEPDARPASTMQQLMQAVVFPNANVVFAVQLEDPAAMVRDARPSTATNPLTGLYGGWQAVENSGLALAEAADLMTRRGRLCSNGRPVPTLEPEWVAAVRAMRDAGLAVATAARAKNQERVGELADAVTESCSGCHRVYRVRGNSCVAARPPAGN